MPSPHGENILLASLLVLIAALIPVFIFNNYTDLLAGVVNPDVIPGDSGKTSSLVNSSIKWMSNVKWKNLFLNTFITIWRVLLYPLHTAILPWRMSLPVIAAVVYPAILAFKYMLAVALFPYKLLIMLAKALYPIYVFMGTACIIGLTVGFVGKLTLQGIFRVLWSSKTEEQPKDTTSRHRKRKDVGAQSYQNRKRVRRQGS